METGHKVLMTVITISVIMIVNSVILLYVAGLVDIKRRTFLKALGILTISMLLYRVLSEIATMHTVIELAAFFIIFVLVIIPIFNTTFMKAFCAAFLSLCLFFLMGGIVFAFLFATGLVTSSFF